MTKGFTPPYSVSGRSALVPDPPWHYAGRVISMEARVDPDAAASFLPATMGAATGRAFGHWCEWQATTDGRELLDPAYALYNEFFLLLEAERDGAPALYCPFIYVDQDIALVRGQLQGWPKKLGSVNIAKSFAVDHPAAAPIRAGTRMGASVAVKDRRIAEAEWTYTGEAGARMGFLEIPTYGEVGHPTLIGGPDRGEPRLVRQDVSATAIGDLHAIDCGLRTYPSPNDELADLAPQATGAGSVCDFALTVVGVRDD
ncbi:MAG: acetoacetate decarboxylase family protein [Litorimonas sp.]